MSTSTDKSEVSLLDSLDLQQLNCLNEDDGHGVKALLSAKARNTVPDRYLLSDSDEQLLINIHFNQTVRVRSIVLQSSNVEQGPKSIKLLINRPAIGFEDVEDAEEPEAAQVLELTEDQVKDGTAVPLRFVRFQAVNSLHIFVASNQGGDDNTRIDLIDVVGYPLQGTRDLSGLQRKDE